MKYVATINGKKYEVEVEKLEAYKSLDRNGVAAPAAPGSSGIRTGTETGSTGSGCSSTGTSTSSSTGTGSSSGSGGSSTGRRNYRRSSDAR